MWWSLHTSSVGTGGSMLFNSFTDTSIKEKNTWELATSNSPVLSSTISRISADNRLHEIDAVLCFAKLEESTIWSLTSSTLARAWSLIAIEVAMLMTDLKTSEDTAYKYRTFNLSYTRKILGSVLVSFWGKPALKPFHHVTPWFEWVTTVSEHGARALPKTSHLIRIPNLEDILCTLNSWNRQGRYEESR